METENSFLFFFSEIDAFYAANEKRSGNAFPDRASLQCFDDLFDLGDVFVCTGLFYQI